MVSLNVKNSIRDVKASSVTTSRVTGQNEHREFSNMDLAMKLHYIKALYFFKTDAVHGIDIYDIKKPMFELLDHYYPASGRIRRSETGVPFIKCNDGGVRIFEAKCDKSVDEWLGLKDHSLDDQLAQSQVLGPELGFSPLVFLQFTWFSCGGLSVGLSWAHVLGDFFSASAFINMWAHFLSQNQVSRQPLTLSKIQKFPKIPNSLSAKPFSLKTIDSVGDTWLVPNKHKMGKHSFHITAKVLQKAEKQKEFTFLTALLWKSISKVRKMEMKVVTICTKGSMYIGDKIPDNNNQVVGIVEAGFDVMEADLFDVTKLVDEKMVDEKNVVEAYVGENSGTFDFIFYGANLTFVNLEEANLYGLEIQGKKPVFANLFMDGVGEEGAVFVLPRAEEGGGDGRTVTVVLLENEIVELKHVLKKEWGIF